MRKFYLLSPRCETFWRYVLSYELNNLNDYPLLTGDVLELEPTDVELTVKDIGRWPDLLNNPLSWLIVSSKLKRVFEEFASEFCRFYALNDCLRGTEIMDKNYWLLSFTRKFDCMDRKRSDFRETNEMLIDIANLVID